MTSFVLIPLCGRDGAIRASTKVDVSDVAFLTESSWSLQNTGYAGARIGGRLVLMHRFLLGLEHGDQRIGDHINCDRLDNRRANLRAVPSRAVNMQNISANRGSSSTLRGVSWDKERSLWMARCGRQHLGRYSTEEEAGSVAAAFRAAHLPYSQEALAAA